MSHQIEKEGWYYDACALDYGKAIYGEIINKRNPIRRVVSHLSLGEAYGNCRFKGPEQESAFLQLMRIAGKRMEIVGHDDGVETIFNSVREKFPRLSFTDAMHLATAIKNRCCVFRTADGDFDLEPAEIRDFVRKDFNIPNFKINKIE